MEHIHSDRSENGADRCITNFRCGNFARRASRTGGQLHEARAAWEAELVKAYGVGFKELNAEAI